VILGISGLIVHLVVVYPAKVYVMKIVVYVSAALILKLIPDFIVTKLVLVPMELAINKMSV